MYFIRGTSHEAIMRPFLHPEIRSTLPSSSYRPPLFPSFLSSPSSIKPFTTTSPAFTSHLYSSHSNPHRAYYQTHGRALFKCLTLAFLTYQVVYWTWLTLETEEIKDRKNREIRGLEGEVGLLNEGRRSHLAGGRDGKGVEDGKRKK